MIFIALKRLGDALQKWTSSTVPSLPLVRFRRIFAAIWLVYDLLDWQWGGTLSVFWLFSDRSLVHQIGVCQVGLIFCEFILVLDKMPRIALFLAFCFRSWEASIFSLNDFLYYCVTALILMHLDSSYLGKKGRAQAWVRDVLLLETVWIYLNTAFLKLNPAWLTGGDLYSRAMLQLSTHSWPYPQFFKTWMSGLAGTSVLAWSAVIGEFLLAGLLGIGFWGGERGGRAFSLARVLVVLIHGFAALALNVWFFGMSMVTQVYFLTDSLQEQDL